MVKAIEIRDRVKELRRVRAGDLRPAPGNWRLHPKAQSDALMGALKEIGFAGALLARETPEGLELLDGHLRRELTPDMVVPVLVTDLDEAEAKLFLATYDPLGAMAAADKEKLDELLKDVQTGDAAVMAMLAELAEKSGLTYPNMGPELDEHLADGVELCICTECGNEHARVRK